MEVGFQARGSDFRAAVWGLGFFVKGFECGLFSGSGFSPWVQGLGYFVLASMPGFKRGSEDLRVALRPGFRQGICPASGCFFFFWRGCIAVISLGALFKDVGLGTKV